jgi:hypothetical protein
VVSAVPKKKANSAYVEAGTVAPSFLVFHAYSYVNCSSPLVAEPYPYHSALSLLEPVKVY